MPIKKWILQYVAMLIVLSIGLAFVQYTKGRDLEYSVQFGMLWSFLATTMFLGTRIYYYRKNIYCAVCNDLPETSNGNDKNA
jgi:hypothetical protein